MAETKQESFDKYTKPIIPVFTVPQPLFPSSNYFNINAQSELDEYKREYFRLLRDNQKLL